MFCGDLDGWDGAGWEKKRGDICMHTAALLHYTAETNITL